MKNNFKALLMHFIIVALSFIFLVIFVATGPKTGKYTTNIISRVFIGSMFILAYIFSGTLLDRDANQKYDFFVGIFVGIIGIVLWFYIFSKTRVNLFEVIPKELSGLWILVNIYYTPFVLIDFLFGLPNIPILSLATNLIPTLLMGLAVGVKLVVTFPNIYSAILTCSSSSLDGGFNQTVLSRVQSRTAPDQRSGYFCLAAS